LRPNLPGTTDARNWSRRLPLTLEALRRDRRPRLVGGVLARRSLDGAKVPPAASPPRRRR
jgi:4-alpha-glucanotransferase